MSPRAFFSIPLWPFKALVCCVAYIAGAYHYDDWRWCTARCLWAGLKTTMRDTYERSQQERVPF